MSLSKVKHVQPSGTYDSNYGLLYKYEYTFEDGVSITANHKKEGGNFQVGAEVEYEVKGTNDKGSWGSVKKPDTGNFPSNASKPQVNGDAVQLMIVKQSSLKVALDLIRHNSIASDSKIQAGDVMELAGQLTKWVIAEEKPYTPNAVEGVAQEVSDNLQG